MRGFPLLSALLVAMAFALAWWPLQKAMTGDAPAAPAVHDPAPASQSPVTLRIHGSASIRSLRVEHLGQPLIERPDGFSGELRHEIPALEIPAEGIEFWVEARLESGQAAVRSALAIEVSPETGDPLTVTLWSDESGALADTALFLWKPE